MQAKRRILLAVCVAKAVVWKRNARLIYRAAPRLIKVATDKLPHHMGFGSVSDLLRESLAAGSTAQYLAELEPAQTM